MIKPFPFTPTSTPTPTPYIGFCVTGSADTYLRVWPLDFSDYYLQAKHPAAVTHVEISGDGLKVIIRLFIYLFYFTFIYFL